ncbi:hypothetical protein CJ191_01125 [Aerococcus viridans]|uniref:Phage protein n=1 Tax=Aerococcus viridans TaxID=1377 RepID=A0A2N6UFP2_9LACT|nr:tail assembly chaperone [Aerococcus viridans]PMC80439.1 hypothetical protein CJ191_01125 [Aerococcus viridans]
MEFLIKNKPVDIKFNYALMFKMNKRLGTKDKETGERGSDGVGAFFLKVLDCDDTALTDLIQLADKTATEDDAIKAIEAKVDPENEEETYLQIFEDLKSEMVESGFFKTKILKYIENMEQSTEMLKARKDENSKLQVVAVQRLVSRMKDALK